MSQYDLVVRGGDVLLPGSEPTRADIAVRNGRIAAIVESGAELDSRETADATGRLVMPGILDVHLHLGHGADISRPRVPEDAASETGAAAAGGVTTIIPYLMGTTAYEHGLFDEVRAVTEAGARVDFGYHFIIATEDQLAGIPYYAEQYGVPTFKIFMNNRGGEGKRLGLPDIDDGFMFRLLSAASAHGGMVCPHPENIEVSWVLRDKLKAADPEGQGGLPTWNASRPPFVEADAIQRAAILSRAAASRLYLVHTSSAEALDAALTYKDSDPNLFIETCPHYLTHDETWAGGDVGKINPPLRSASDREGLWDALEAGLIDTVATDHVHRDVAAKTGGIWNASPGAPGLETMLPVMISEGYHKRGIPLSTLAAVLCANPARIMGLPQKGQIAIGKDADLVLVDLEAEWTPQRSQLFSNAGYSIYEGWPVRGRVTDTFLRGSAVFRNGALVDEAIGTGRYVARQLTRTGGV